MSQAKRRTYKPGTPEHDAHLKYQHELVEAWRVDNFESEDYHTYLGDMMIDGHPKLHSMILKRTIFKAIRSLCFTDVKPTADELRALSENEGDRDEMVWESMERGASLFTRRSMRLRIWTPEGGLTLESYYFNGCVMKFKDVFTTWREQRSNECNDDEFLASVVAAGPTVAEMYDPIADFEKLIAGESERNRAILRLRFCDGLEYKEITDRMGLAPHIVRGVLDRFKNKVTKVNID